MASKKGASRGGANTGPGFTEEEREAIREAVRERRGRPSPSRAEGEREVLAKIAAMTPSDRVMAERLHALMKTAAPGLSARTWYGMPAYANADGVVCFFQSGQKFKTRYATFGFSDEARLDDGRMWPTSFALTALTASEESRIVALVKKAVAAQSPT